MSGASVVLVPSLASQKRGGHYECHESSQELSRDRTKRGQGAKNNPPKISHLRVGTMRGLSLSEDDSK
jgi:hypothetical protein